MLKFFTLSACLAASVQAHGALSFPASRQWTCSGGASPNNNVGWNGFNGHHVCNPEVSGDQINTVITDWSGLAHRNAAGQTYKLAYSQNPQAPHIKAAGGRTAPICSANLPEYSALDNPVFTENLGGQPAGKPDYPTVLNIAIDNSGETNSYVQTFEYSVTASHKTCIDGYLDHYITRDGVFDSAAKASEHILTWEDLEPEPFCHYQPSSCVSPLQGGVSQKTEKYACEIPKNKTGQHVIYTVWQRHDSDEAFYSCSDLVINVE